ncbi:MbtH family protein [Streptomyces sp. NPDC059862]|uniref:MbtH family protein n=1 Tax=unclassified Streptomyces TaxID=2593676 RepID=UPI00362C3CD0
MTNPFDNEDGTFHVLVNAERQYCLWPAFALVPPGWEVVVADSDRQTCLDHIEKNWTDMRPASLAGATDAA